MTVVLYVGLILLAIFYYLLPVFIWLQNRETHRRLSDIEARLLSMEWLQGEQP